MGDILRHNIASHIIVIIRLDLISQHGSAELL